MTPISAAIIAFNEEQHIGRCLDSLRGVADDIVVLDSFSTDATPFLCRSRGVRFVQQAFTGFIEQKNLAVSMALHDTVLLLDADECLSDELKQSLMHIMKEDLCDGYFMNRRNWFCDRWIRHAGWYPDRKLRLWNRKKGTVGGMNPHDRVVMQKDAVLKWIPGDLLHYTVQSIDQHRDQMNRFASEAAKAMAHKRNSGVLLLSLVPVFPALWVLIKRFLLQRGFLEGKYGWIISLEAARYTWRKYSRAGKIIREKKTY